VRHQNILSAHPESPAPEISIPLHRTDEQFNFHCCDHSNLLRPPCHLLSDCSGLDNSRHFNLSTTAVTHMDDSSRSNPATKDMKIPVTSPISATPRPLWADIIAANSIDRSEKSKTKTWKLHKRRQESQNRETCHPRPCPSPRGKRLGCWTAEQEVLDARQTDQVGGRTMLSGLFGESGW
jgi:hypothetical protein